MAINKDRREAAQGWAGEIVFTGGSAPVAYRPAEVLVQLDPADPDRSVERLERFVRSRERAGLRVAALEDLGGEGELADRRRTKLDRFRKIVDLDADRPEVLARELRAEGFSAAVNHVFFAHCAQGCCGPHPALAGGVAGSPVYASPVYASPVYASPVYASPVYASPVYASPVYASPVYASGAAQATGRRRSSVRPATAEEGALVVAGIAAGAAQQGQQAEEADLVDVAILDTGGCHADFASPLVGLHGSSQQLDRPDDNADTFIDPVAGHGEFIAGLVRSVAPHSRILVLDVLTPLGEGDEQMIANAIYGLPAPRARGSVLNLSFGGYALDERAILIADAVVDAQARGWVVVASAGNDATCRPTYPAALPGVISVGAVGPYGPAPFTNYGPWVRACAPGVDLVSTFFRGFADDPETGPFDGWARWSGTSFAAPIVAGAIVQEMTTYGVRAGTAVDRLIDAPGLLRLDGLGTVVNRI